MLHQPKQFEQVLIFLQTCAIYICSETGKYSPIISFDWKKKIPNQLPIVYSLLIFPNNTAHGVSELKFPFPKTLFLSFVPGIRCTLKGSQQWLSCSFIFRHALPGWEWNKHTASPFLPFVYYKQHARHRWCMWQQLQHYQQIFLKNGRISPGESLAVLRSVCPVVERQALSHSRVILLLTIGNVTNFQSDVYFGDQRIK